MLNIQITKLHRYKSIIENVFFSGSAVVSVGNHLSHEQEEAARAAKHIYLPPAANQSQRNVYNERERAVAAAIHPRSLAPPPAAHSSVTPSSVAAAAAAAAAYNRQGSLVSGFSRYSLPGVTTSNAVTLASTISTSPRLAHAQNGTGNQPPSRYYTSRE